MGTSALGGFVSGLQGGIEFRANRKRDRLLDQAIQNELAGMENRSTAALKDRAEAGLDNSDFRTGADFEVEDPYGWGLKNWFNNFKGNFRDSAIGRTFMRQPEPEPEPEPERRYGAVPLMADGGALKKDLISAKERVAGGRKGQNVLQRWLAERGGARDVLNKSKLAKAGGAVATGAAILDQTEQDYDERMDERFGEWGWGGEDRGDPSLGGALEFGAKRALGFASDLGDKLTFGQASRLYRDNRSGPAVAPEQAAAVQNSDVTEPEPAPQGAATAAQPAPAQAPRQAVPAQQAQEGPSWAGVQAAPEDVPRMATKDWEKYRKHVVDVTTLRGGTAAEAHEQVTQMQQRGFLTHANQAFQLLNAGDWKGASLALTAAYQYFPNGADVKFGMHTDAQGQPALVAMGTSEETGEPQGTPMLITKERLAVMMENMSNPNAFRTWTKDWRNEEFERQIYEEYTKPLGEAKAETDRINARAREASAAASYRSAVGRGGLKHSDVRAAASDFRERLGMMSMDPKTESQADYLAGIMAQVYTRSGGQIDPNSIIALVMSASDGDEQSLALLQQLGISFGE